MSTETTEAVASGAGEAAPAPEVTTTAPVTETVETKAEVTKTEPAKPEKPAKPMTLDEKLTADLQKTFRKVQGKKRDETGKFAPEAPKPELAKAEVSPEGTTETQAPQPEAKTPDQAATPIEAPRNFTAEQKAEFAKLPREAQEHVARVAKSTEAEFTKRAQEHSEFRKQAETFKQQAEQYHRSTAPLLQALEPFRQYLTQTAATLGTPVPQMIAGLVQTEARLRTGSPQQKMAALAEIANSYGVPLDGAQFSQPSAEANALTQELQRTQAELNQIKGFLSQQQQAMHEQRQHAERETQGELQQHIAEFAKDHPYLDEVRPHAAALLSQGLAKDLAEAYDMAVYANPTVRARVLADQRRAEEAQRSKEAQARAEQARRAAAVNVNSAPSQPSPKTMDETLRDTLRRIKSAA